MSTRLERYLGFPNEFRLVKKVSKHQSGTHDQQSHGNWAGGVTERASQVARVQSEGDGSLTYQYGDLQFTDKTLPMDNRMSAYNNWNDMGGNYQMRTVSAAFMGLDRPRAEGASELSDWTIDFLETGKNFNAGTTAEKTNLKQRIVDTHTLLEAAFTGRGQTEMYRGIFVPQNETGFDNLQRGQTFKMPLTAFTNNQDSLKTYETKRGDEKGVTFTLRSNARGYDNAEPKASHEFITQGEFEVVEVAKKTNATNITLRQTQGFNPRKNRYEK